MNIDFSLNYTKSIIINNLFPFQLATEFSPILSWFMFRPCHLEKPFCICSLINLNVYFTLNIDTPRYELLKEIPFLFRVLPRFSLIIQGKFNTVEQHPRLYLEERNGKQQDGDNYSQTCIKIYNKDGKDGWIRRNGRKFAGKK